MTSQETNLHHQLRILQPDYADRQKFYDSESEQQLDLLQDWYNARGAKDAAVAVRNAYTTLSHALYSGVQLTASRSFPKLEKARADVTESVGMTQEDELRLAEWIRHSDQEDHVNNLCNSMYLYLALKQKTGQPPEFDALKRAMEHDGVPEEWVEQAAGDDDEEYYQNVPAEGAEVVLDPELALAARRYAGLVLAEQTLGALLDNEEEQQFFDEQVDMDASGAPKDVASTLEDLFVEIGEEFLNIDGPQDLVVGDDLLDPRAIYAAMRFMQSGGDDVPLNAATGIMLSDYANTASLLNAAQEKVDALSADNQALKDENAALKAKLTELQQQLATGQKTQPQQGGWADSRHVQPKQISAGSGREGRK